VTGYVDGNRQHWDSRADAHAASPDYGVERFLTDPSYLSEIVRFDRPRLGDLSGTDAVHLQCHIGTDTLSLARLGARMTGLDFSAQSLTQARRLADAVGADIDYRHGEVYDAVEVLGAARFDLVYTGIGALCWLPSVARWAQVVADLLRPGGRLFVREGHPMLWALDESADQPVLAYPYFETQEPMLYEESDTYVATDQPLPMTRSATWNHGLGEIVTALLDRGLSITQFAEHDSVPWNALPGQMAPDDRGEYRLLHRPDRLAASYTLEAVKSRPTG
jgi:SAM-dependent methyltransferase